MLIAKTIINQILKDLKIDREQLNQVIEAAKNINIKNLENEINIDLSNIEIKIKKNEKTP